MMIDDGMNSLVIRACLRAYGWSAAINNVLMIDLFTRLPSN